VRVWGSFWGDWVWSIGDRNGGCGFVRGRWRIREEERRGLCGFVCRGGEVLGGVEGRWCVGGVESDGICVL
jgi:hypothetical protein